MVRYLTDLGYRTMRYPTVIRYCNTKGKIVTFGVYFVIQKTLEIYPFFKAIVEYKSSHAVIKGKYISLAGCD